MTNREILALISAAGMIAEPAPPRPDPLAAGRPLGGSVNVRYVDTGGCNDCAMEIASAFGPVYDIERYGIHLVASARHADVLLVTGVVTRNMVEPLRRTIEATPTPRLVIAVGDCAISGGPFTNGYGVSGIVSDFVPVDIEVAGSPPHPAAIVEALRKVSGR